MQLRTFLAKDMSGALSEVRREMGPEAVILSSESTADGGVLVRAALDSANAYDDVTFSDASEPAEPEVLVQPEEEAEVLAQLQAVCRAASGVVNARGGAAAQPVPAEAENGGEGRVLRGGAGLLAKVRRPSAAVSSITSVAKPSAEKRNAAPAEKKPPAKAPPPADHPARKQTEGEVRPLHRRNRTRAPGVAKKFDRAELLAIFAHHRLPDSLAHLLAERSAESGIRDMTLALASALDERMHATPIDFTAVRGLLLTGPGGVGKTATAAKMAAHAQLAGRDVCLIAADTEGAGAVERLAAFARHLQAECIAASSTAAAQRAVRGAQARGILPIVDTAGCDPRRPVETLGAAVRGVEIIGIVSAMTDSEEMGEIAEAMRLCDISRLVVTQADMTRRFGAVVTAALSEGMGLAHITRSPFVADGLELMSPHRLARILIESKEESVQ